MLEKQKNNNVRVTPVLFDDQYEMLTNRVDFKYIKELDKEKCYISVVDIVSIISESKDGRKY